MYNIYNYLYNIETSDISKTVLLCDILWTFRKYYLLCAYLFILFIELFIFDPPSISQYLSNQLNNKIPLCCMSARWITCSKSRDRYARNYIACHHLIDRYTSARKRRQICAEIRVEAFVFPSVFTI